MLERFEQTMPNCRRKWEKSLTIEPDKLVNQSHAPNFRQTRIYLKNLQILEKFQQKNQKLAKLGQMFKGIASKIAEAIACC